MMQSFVQAILKTQSSYRQIIQRRMRENSINLTFEMLHIMRFLAKNEKINQQELANTTFKDKSSLSYLIKNMEKRGFVIREEDDRDKRSKLVMLTNDGKRLYEQVRIIVEDVYSSIEREVNLDHMKSCINYMDEFNEIIKEN
ncbi:MarR family winged helix-turn-helix transcriptional regulator [Dysgonomonas sp. ZJ709]|uniref:MarR family winged helix-turn-helix transcriptional regulator n=1 Tax=Dysgonomonas sp. ZJ709 TaxID=2709797 RepID=UPI0013EAC986|nr:MarR family transcriptional regulator [Dysgonomonas sp. ZJ709]